MIYYYAFLNDQDIVTQIVTLPSIIDDPHYIRIDFPDESLVGKRYNRETGQFEDVITLEGGKRYAAVVIGTASSGHTEEEVDFLCNGIDDQNIFRTAVSALGPNGGTLVVREGIYRIAGSISIGKNTTVTGSGSSTVLQAANGMMAAIFTVAGEGVMFSQMKLAGETTASGIDLESKNGEVRDMVFEGLDFGLSVAEGTKVTNCSFTDCNTGVGARQSVARCLFQGNHFFNCLAAFGFGTGSVMYTVQDSIITANWVRENSRQFSGTAIYGNLTRCEIEDNHFLSKHSIHADRLSSVKIVGNEMETENGDFCIKASYMSEMLLSGNILSGISRQGYGIDGRGGDSKNMITVSGNIIKGFSYGIFVKGYGIGNNYTGNTFFNLNEGIYLENVSGAVISANCFNQNSCSIYLGTGAEHCNVTGNNIDAVTPAGGWIRRNSILLDGGASDNLVNGNKVRSVDIKDTSNTNNNTISSNKFVQ